MHLTGVTSDAVKQLASKRLTKDGESSNVMSESRVSLGIIFGNDCMEDTAYVNYKKALCNWKSAQDTFPLAKYDPLNL